MTCETNGCCFVKREVDETHSSQELGATLLERITALVPSRSLASDPPADLGGVVEDRPAGDASGELEHVAEPLAHALGGLTPEDPGGLHAGVREGDGGVLAPGSNAADPEVGLTEVDLDLAGQPAQGQVALGVPAVSLLGYLFARLFT